MSEKNLIDFLDNIYLRKANEVNQDSSLATYAEKIDRQETEILWDIESAELIERKIRALFPKYGSFTFLGEKRIKILNSNLEKSCNQLAPGEIFVSDKNHLYVGCLDGKILKILNLQMEGRQPVNAKEFIKGNAEKLLLRKNFSRPPEK